jgi:hypothetical protein
MANDQEVKYSATLDVSKFVSNSQKAAQAAQSIGKASSSASPAKALDAHSASVAKLADKYKMLEKSRSFFDKEPAQLKQIDQQQQRILKNLTSMAKTEQEYAKYAKLSLDYNSKNVSLTQHSNRQSGQLKGIALQMAGQGIMQAGAYGRQLYGAGISSYQNLNSQYSIDPNLTAANRNLTRSKLGLGAQLSGYEAFKTNLQAGINKSPLAAPLAIGGDVLGAAAPAAGGIMQMLGALKTVNPKAAESIGEMALKFGGILGKGGVLGAAAVAGGVVGINVGNALNKTINPKAKDQDWGDVLTTVKKTIALDVGAATGMNKHVVGGVGSILGVSPNNGSDVGSVWADIWGDGKGADKIRKENQQKNQKKAQEEKTTQQAQVNTEFKKVINSPQFQLQAAQVRNQIGDFNYDSAKNERLAKRGYARQKEDIGTSRSRTNEDYAVQQQKFGIQRQRMDEDYSRSRSRTEEDYTRTVQKNELQVSRIRRDAVISATRQNEDLSRSRIRQAQDVSRQTERLDQDTSRDTLRLNQDTARDTLRLTQDTDRERLRSAQDYGRNLAVMNRDQARSSQDLQRNFKDSLTSIIAPGLTSSKGYQIAKLMRDYKREKGRMGEDQAQQRSDLERDRSRQVEDIDRTASRGAEDIGRSAARGAEDIGRNSTRSKEDIARGNERFGEDTSREQSRGSQDLQKQTTDALTDSFIAAKEAAIEHTRTVQDQDREYARARQDESLAEADAAREHTRNLQDLAKEEKRAAEDFKETMDDIRVARERFARDMNLQLTQMGADLADKTGSNKNYTADEVANAAGIGNVVTANPNSTNSGGDYASGLANKLLGRYANGTDYVPQTGAYILEKGEGVITEAANRQAGANQAVAGGANAAQLNPNSPWQTFMRQMAGGTFGQSAGAASSNGGFDLGAIQSSAASSAAGMLGGLAGAGNANTGTAHDQAWYTAQSSAAWQKHNADLVSNIQSQTGSSDAVSEWRNQMLAQFQMYNNGGLAGGSGNTTGGGAFGGNYTTPGASGGGGGLSNGSLEGQGPSWLDNFGPAILAKRQGYRPPMRGGNGGGGGALHYNPTYNIGSGGGMHPQIQQEIDRHKTALNGIANTIYSSVY